MIRNLIIAALATASLPAVAHAQAMTGKTYIAKAGAGDLYEKQSSMLVEKSTNPKVREFAQHMIADHTKSTNDVKAAAMQAHIMPAPPKLDAMQARNIAKLRAAKGSARDTMYLAQQKVAHNEALALHQGYADHGTVAPLKATAASIAPVVQSHIDMLAGM